MVDSGVGPGLYRRQLGAVLRQMRVAKGLTLERVAGQIDTSAARLSRIENGQANATLKGLELSALLEIYEVTDLDQVSELQQMHRNSQRRDWWAGYGPVMPAGYSTVVGLETDATAERVWEPALIPGLVQTEDYAREVMKTGRAGKRDVNQAGTLVDLRLKRQQVLTREPHPLHLWAVIGQAALESDIGGPEVMRAQVQHLIEAAQRPTITIQVMPTAAGAHPGINGPFTLIEATQFPTVTYIETSEGTIYLEKAEDVQRYDEAFRQMCTIALDLKQSLEFLHTLT